MHFVSWMLLGVKLRLGMLGLNVGLVLFLGLVDAGDVALHSLSFATRSYFTSEPRTPMRGLN
jgi:hypothetical protein